MLKRHEARGCNKWNRRQRHGRVVVVKWLQRGNPCVVWTHRQTSLILDDVGPSHVVVVVAQNAEECGGTRASGTFCAKVVDEWHGASGKRTNAELNELNMYRYGNDS